MSPILSIRISNFEQVVRVAASPVGSWLLAPRRDRRPLRTPVPAVDSTELRSVHASPRCFGDRGASLSNPSRNPHLGPYNCYYCSYVSLLRRLQSAFNMTELRNKYKFNSAEEQKLYDVRSKMEIAKLIVSLCSDKDKNIILDRNLLINRATQYFTRKILTDLEEKMNATTERPTTFKNWIEQTSIRYSNGIENCNTIKDLRDTYIDYYLVKKSLPTKEDIVTKTVNTNQSLNKSHVEIVMKSSGYKWKRLPHCTKSIVVEDPEQIMARMKYLKSIEQIRSLGSHIIYIEDRNDDETLFFVAVSPIVGIISKKIVNISEIVMPASGDEKYSLLTKWILDDVVPQVSVPSIFVLKDNNSNAYGDMPTMYSSRNVMIGWLELNGIPHNSNMHSAELFELIKRSYRNFSKKNILDEYLKSYGHKILLRPSKTQYLNYFNIFWEKLKSISNSLKEDELNKTSLLNWKELERILIEIETKTLKEDIEVNNTIEKIFTITKHERIPYDCIEKCDDHFDEFRMEETVQIT